MKEVDLNKAETTEKAGEESGEATRVRRSSIEIELRTPFWLAFVGALSIILGDAPRYLYVGATLLLVAVLAETFARLKGR